MAGQERQKGMCGSTSDNLQSAELLKFLKDADEISCMREIIVSCGDKPVMIKQGKLVKSFFPMSTMNFFLSQVDQAIQVAHITVLEELVAQHRAKGGSEGEC